ncbi:hypothetical protein NA78x_003371 [Anatilimnocola sp. NA78]|uniref:hypothetical protein n=1 Tax=Anatilimnocola sp. NA78 TaxID=3415683 RepID=UPI003CE49A42
MPLKINVGLSKKVGLPDYGSLGASCHVEYEADASLLNTDLEAFHRQVKNAYVACKQAVQDELHRHQSVGAAAQPLPANGKPAHGQRRSNGAEHGHSNGSSNSSSPRRSNGRKATASQLKALDAISNRLQLDLERWLMEKHGLRMASELTVAEASAAIDDLNATPSNSGRHS